MPARIIAPLLRVAIKRLSISANESRKAIIHGSLIASHSRKAIMRIKKIANTSASAIFQYNILRKKLQAQFISSIQASAKSVSRLFRALARPRW
jgi:hypothetical protein